MTRFGTELFCTFLDRSWPLTPDAVLEPVTWADVTKLFFENAGLIRARGELSEPLWTASAVKELDNALRNVAELGEFVLVPVHLSPAAMAELWRRWQFAIVGAELEKRFGSPLNISVPRDAPPELKGAAVILYVLGGPAKAYRKDIFREKKKQKQRATKVVRQALSQSYAKQLRKP